MSQGQAAVLHASITTMRILCQTTSQMYVELKGNQTDGFKVYFMLAHDCYVLAQVKGEGLRRFKNLDRAVNYVKDELGCTEFHVVIEDDSK